jgi:CDP-paratose 2-epimerase
MTAPAHPRTDFGFVEWFRPGEQLRVQAAMDGMSEAGAVYLRTHLSWAEYHAPGGEAWYDWLLPILGERFDLLPCIHYTPPSLSRTGRSSGAPRRLKDYADFVDHVLTRYGRHFQYVELWNEPNNLLDWDWRADPDWRLFSEMIGNATYWVERRGWKAVLGGLSPFDPHWLELMGRNGVLSTVSAVGFHGFPGTWDSEAGSWMGYDHHLAELRAVLDRHQPEAEVWVTEAGYSTWRHDEAEQVERFREALTAPAQRLYWYCWQDIPRSVAVQEGRYFDPRHYHLGVTDAVGRPKLLRRLLRGNGVSKLIGPSPLAAPAVKRKSAPSLILGGAGFIGANLADRLLHAGEEVIILDNLSRAGVERNLAWLRGAHGGRLHVANGDVRDAEAMDELVADASGVFHFAAQVAVTSSLEDPREDFAVNTQGTLTVLEAIRRRAPAVPMLYASTNKVYGTLRGVRTIAQAGCHVPESTWLQENGIDETAPLDFCTPYGCSKGAAEQYVLDYAHSFGLRTAVLRMSCIYGPRQFGTEDQGWVAHFLIRALRGQPITIYGDGRQVRDILHVHDAVAAYRAVLDQIDTLAGQAFNLGGGPANAVSLRMVLARIAAMLGREVVIEEAPWRMGDQPWFVANTARLRAASDWRATIGWREGMTDLAAWLSADLGLPVGVPARNERRLRA